MFAANGSKSQNLKGLIDYSILSLVMALFLLLGSTNSASAYSRLSHLEEENVSLYSVDDSKVPALMSWDLSPEQEVEAIVLAIHGFSLHKGTFKAFAKALKQKGIVTYAIDIRGFGAWYESDDERMVLLEKSVADIGSVLTQLKETYPGKKIFLVGESMGGALAIQVASKHKNLVDGLITSVPSFKVKGKKRSAIAVLFRMLIYPNAQINVGAKILSLATSDKGLKKSWKMDPYSRLKVSALELFNYAKFMSKNKEAARKIKNLPVLFVQGSDDRLIKKQGNKELFSEIRSYDKELVVMDSYEHLIFEKGQFDLALVDLVSGWMHGQRKVLIASNL